MNDLIPANDPSKALIAAYDPPPPEIGREIATIANGQDITRGYLAPLLVTQDPLLLLRGYGNLQLYEAVKADPEVGAAMQQRRLAITKCETIVKPGGTGKQDKMAADFLREQLASVGWDKATAGMHWGTFYGYAVAEMIYGRESGRVTIDAIKVRNRRRFRFGPEQDLRLLTLDNMIEGVPCEAPYFWHYATGADHDDEPYGLGLAHWLYWPVFFKRNGLKFWMIFLDKFGMPTAQGKYPASATAGERQALLAALRAIQTDAGVITPEGMVIELLQATRSGTADYNTLVEVMNSTIAKVVVGNTASMQGVAGKLGEEKLHGEVRRELVKADSELICESFNRGPARWLTAWNFPKALPPIVSRDVDEPEDLVAASTRDKNIASMGFKPKLAYIQEHYGGDWTETKAAPPADPLGAADAADAPSFADPSAAESRAHHADQEAIAVAAASFAEQWHKLTQPRMKQLLVLLDETGDLDLFRKRLAEFADADPSTDAVTALQRAGFAAQLLARTSAKTKAAT